MNRTTSKAIHLIVLIAGLIFLIPSAYCATYSYVGSNYTNIQNFQPVCNHAPCYSYSESMSVSGQFTVANPLSANLSDADIAAQITSISFSDGVQTLTNSNASWGASVSTNSSGKITSAWISLKRFTNGPPYTAGSWYNHIKVLYDQGDVGAVNVQCYTTPCLDVLTDVHAFSVAGSGVQGTWTSSTGSGGFVPRTGLWSVTSELNGEPGRGFQIEVNNNVMVLTVYGYDHEGKGVFYLGTGNYNNGAFSGPLDYYKNGITFGGPTKSGVYAGTAGEVSVNLIDGSHGTITFPGETPKAISKMEWALGGTNNFIETGLWSVESEINGEPGRGFQVENQNGVMVVTVYGYDQTGNAAFYLATGPVQDDVFTGNLEYYKDGITFGGPQKSGVWAGDAGQITIHFTESNRGTITFPGESPKTVVKFDW